MYPIFTITITFTLDTYRNIVKMAHVLWVDNFSKVFRKSIPTSSTGTYNSCLWTGYAAFIVDDHRVNTTIITNHHGQKIHGMPIDPCDDESVTRVIEGLRYVHADMRSYYDSSTVKCFDVRNIPPKIDTKRHVDMKRTIDDPKNSTQNVHPLKLFKKNIGSNEGLIAVLSDIASTYGMINNTCSDYVILNVDENIYWRIMKVLFRKCLVIYGCCCVCVCEFISVQT